jgi:DNA repair exonuclease SbcCD nuclease subunit
MGRFRFIHAADIHLGSMLHMDGAESKILKQYCRESTYTAFDRLCNAAVDSGARFILISGDLYDREARSVRANRFFADACEKLNHNGINVYVIAGNHDPIREYQEMFTLPPNVRVFGADEPEIFYVMDGAEPLAGIVGQSYKNKWEPSAMHRRFPAPERGVFSIGMLHTQMTPNDKNYVPCTIGELTDNPSIHYWALGHIHKPDILKGTAKGDKPVIAYSGIPQGRDFGEEGPGGCWLVEVDGTEIPTMQYLVTSPVIYRSIPIDIGCEELYEAEGLDQLEDYIVSYAQSMMYEPICLYGSQNSETEIRKHAPDDLSSSRAEGYVIRWILTGRGKLHHFLSSDRRGNEQDLCAALRSRLSGMEPFVWVDSIEVRTGSPVSEDILEQHAVLRDLLEQSMHSISADGRIRNKLIGELGQLWSTSADYEDQDDRKLTLDEETLQVILEDAKQLLVENLVPGGE